jgi:hypothetical protein
MTRCLVVTELCLSGLHARKHGIYQRFRLLLDGLIAAGYTIELVCVSADGLPASPQDRADIEQELLTTWQIQARVIATTPRGRDTRWPYLVQQILGALSYNLHEAVRSGRRGGITPVLQAALQTRPDLVLAHRLASMMHLIRASKHLPPCYFDLDDVEHRAALRSANHMRQAREKAFAYLSLPACVAAEFSAVHKAWRTLLCAQGDAQHLHQVLKVPMERLSVVPNAAAMEAPQALSHSQVLIMVGVMSYEPNGAGADYFIREVWPRVLAMEPEATFHVIGASPEAIPAFHQQPRNVKFLGFVDDLDEAYREARGVVCPILWGGGTRVKLIEAAVKGKAVVSTTLGCEGLDFRPDQEVLIADDAEHFAQACVQVLRDDALATRLGRQIHEHARARFDRRIVVKALAQAFQLPPP